MKGQNGFRYRGKEEVPVIDGQFGPPSRNAKSMTCDTGRLTSSFLEAGRPEGVPAVLHALRRPL